MLNVNLRTFLARLPLLRGPDRLSDPKRESAVSATSVSEIDIGVVMRSTPGTQDVEVNCHGKVWTCTCMVGVCNAEAGAAESGLPVERSVVVVAKTDKDNNIGVVLGVLPRNNPIIRADSTPKNPRFGFESGACPADDPAFALPMQNSAVAMLPASAERALDQHPGDWSVANPSYGTSLRVSGPVVAMAGSDRAGIRASALDDSLRLDSETFRHVHAAGESQVFNDSGFISAVHEFATYQSERLGMAKLGSSIFVQAAAKLCSLKGFKAAWQMLGRMRSQPRLKVFCGHLGGLIHAFIVAPKRDGEVALASDKTPDQGLFACHAGADGRFTVKSVNGICFQRTDRIAVPRRKRFPWDPAGARADKEAQAPARGPFKFKDSVTRAMQLRDAEAWRSGTAYAAFRKQLKGDFATPDERELPTPDDVYDEQSGNSAEHQANAGRMAIFSMEPDGSVIIRAGNGEEIVMGDGYITLSAPKGIRVASGQSVTVLAGDDVVLKAKKSIDVTATENDVRIKAENNLHVVAASETRGNILLESRATTQPAPNGAAGEEFSNSGIVIKASESKVYVNGGATQIHADADVTLESDVGVRVVAPIVTASASGTLRLEAVGTGSKDGSVLVMDSAQLLALVPAVAINTLSGVSLSKDKDSAVMTWSQDPWEDSKTEGAYSRKIKPERKTMHAKHTPSAKYGPYTAQARASSKFSYRAPEELGITVSGSLWMQPAWAFMLAQGERPLSGFQLSAWDEKAIDGAYPWPGTTAYSVGGYVKLLKETNNTVVKDALASLPVVWDNLADQSQSVSQPLPFSQYEVLSKVK